MPYIEDMHMKRLFLMKTSGKSMQSYAQQYWALLSGEYPTLCIRKVGR